MTKAPYNPLDKRNLGISVAKAMLERGVHPLETLSRFPGAGIYAIYYTGDFPAYRALAEANREDRFGLPIYVGKAIPPGGRKGGTEFPVDSPALFNRLSEHAESISAADNLDLRDFQCRYLVVDDIWIPLGESLLIAMFAPIWNQLIDGFGNHNPGKGRHNGMRSRWDVLHPGRHWAELCQPRRETAEQIAQEAEARLRVAPLPSIPTAGS